MADSISSNMKKVSLTAEVKGLTADAGVPAGKVTFEMVMPRGTKMAGMHAGINERGTAALKDGEATLSVKSSMVPNMELKIVYNGDSHFNSSTVTPSTLTMSGLMGTGMSTGGVGGMSMAASGW